MRLLLLLSAFVLIATDPGSWAGDDGRRPSPDGVLVRDCDYSDESAVPADYGNLISFADPYLGTHDADVTVIEFFDPNCPHCKSMHPIMQEVVARHSDRARFYFIPFVLWQRSLVQVEALYVAASEDKYHTMLDRQFHYQKDAGLGIEELADIAEEIGMDRERFVRRLRQGFNRRSIIERRRQIRNMGVTGTPAVMINGRLTAPSARSVNCLDRMIREAAEAASSAAGEASDGGESDGRR